MAAPTIVEKDAGTTYLLLGKTGIGKSTTGNKLLGVHDSDKDKELYRIHDRKQQQPDKNLKFEEGDITSIVTTTKKCELLQNDYLKITVLDVCGFSSTSQGSSVYATNLSLFRDIIATQWQYNLVFDRIIYFLPVRRFPEKGDGLLQEEIGLMHYYFGDDVFKCMVIVITTSPFDDEELEITHTLDYHTQNVIKAAIKASTGVILPCPPMVFISSNHSGKEVRNKIKHAPVHSPKAIMLHMSDSICDKCNTKSKEVFSSDKLVFYLPDGREKQDHEDLCHPFFISADSTVKRTFGEIMHIMSLGISSRLGMSNLIDYEEICVECQRSRGSKGCVPVHSNYESKMNPGKEEKVYHFNISEELNAYK